MKKMKTKVKYVSKDKVYISTKQNENKLFIMSLVCFISFFGTLICFALGIDKGSTNNYATYEEKGSTNYKVYLKDNSIYDSGYLESGNSYITDLINVINTKFNYEIASNKDMEYEYISSLTGDFYIYDSNGNRVYNKRDILIEPSKTFNTTSRLNVSLEKDINIIDYLKVVSEYKDKYNIDIKAELVLTMGLDIHTNNNDVKKNFDEKRDLILNIPLSNDIMTIHNMDFVNKGEIDSKFIFNDNYAFTGLILFIVTVSLLYILVTDYMNLSKKNIYYRTINNLLREYDDIIVNATNDIREKNFKNIILPESFKELVDAAKTLNSPILYFEAIKGEKAFFLIVNGDTLYKFRLTRAYLDKNGKID